MAIVKTKHAKEKGPTALYTFEQNNSGGRFHVDETVTRIMIIEAYDADHAVLIGKSLGIYLDGVSCEIDCPCCGDRWYYPSENKMDHDELCRITDEWCFDRDTEEPIVRIYRLDGTITEYFKEPKS